MKKIPVYIIYGRLLLGALIPLFALMDGSRATSFLAILICIGFIADIFDGVIARWLNVSTVHLRLLDSIADRLFWIFVVIACVLLYPEFMSRNVVVLIVVFCFDMLVYALSLLRFGKIPSPHNLLTKLWGIVITICYI
jgi:CDP-diacylglycerol--glycerol-3-phosphate 3-phosphatidyltransferase